MTVGNLLQSRLSSTKSDGIVVKVSGVPDNIPSRFANFAINDRLSGDLGSPCFQQKPKAKILPSLCHGRQVRRRIQPMTLVGINTSPFILLNCRRVRLCFCLPRGSPQSLESSRKSTLRPQTGLHQNTEGQELLPLPFLRPNTTMQDVALRMSQHTDNPHDAYA